MARPPARFAGPPAARGPVIPARRASPPARRGASGNLGAAGSAVAYVAAEAVGFDRLPPSVLEFVLREGLLSGEVIAASATDPVAKRRQDGSVYQMASGWWSSNERYLRISAIRELSAHSGARYRPAGPWLVTGMLLLFPPRLRPETSIWQLPATGGPSAAGPASRPKAHVVDDPLEILPSGVARPVRGGSCDAWVEHRRGFARETIVAARELEGRVRSLRATREASSKRALDQAPWRILTLDAPVVATRPIGLHPLRSAPATRLAARRTPPAFPL